MNNEFMVAFLLFGICEFIGIILFIVGMVMLKKMKTKEKNCTSKVYGKVTDIVTHKNYDGNRGYSYSYHPVFEYNIGELKFIKESTYGSSQTKYAIGQDVEIYYNPEDYNDFYVVGENIQKIIGTVFSIIGIIAIIVGILIVIITKIIL